MNTHAQFDLHPDAESLNAFAEQALGERERKEIVAHLAVCSRCREVVFLAQSAASEMEVAEERERGLVVAAAMPEAAVVPAARAEFVALRKPWYRNWRVMWIPVGTLAAVVALLTVIYVRRAEQNPEMAKNVPMAAPQPERSESPAAAAPAPNPGASEPPAKQKAGASSGKRQAMAKGEGKSRALGIAATATPEPKPEVPRPMFGGSGGALQAPAGMMASSHAEGRSQEEKAAPETGSSEEQERPAMKVPAHPPEAAAAPASPAGAAETVTVAQADQLVAATEQAVPGSAGNLKARHVARAANTYAMYKTTPATLPSGLPVVSTASVEHSVLGVDKAGSVFLSEDAGVHWEAIARQWNGRAAAVRAREVNKKDEAGETGTPAAKFELVNDEGRVWLSSDGKTWTAK